MSPYFSKSLKYNWHGEMFEQRETAGIHYLIYQRNT